MIAVAVGQTIGGAFAVLFDPFSTSAALLVGFYSRHWWHAFGGAILIGLFREVIYTIARADRVITGLSVASSILAAILVSVAVWGIRKMRSRRIPGDP